MRLRTPPKLNKRLVLPLDLGLGTFVDTGNVCNGTPVVTADFLTFTSENPATVSATPGAGAFVHWPLQDAAGNTVELDLDDIFAAWMQAASDIPAVDLVLWLACTVGVPSSTSPGIAWGLRYNATGVCWEAIVATNTGASWTVTAASARNTKTTGLLARIVTGTDDGQARPSAEATNPAHEPNTTTSVPIISSGAATNGRFTKISVGFGWATGTGGVAGSVGVKVDYLLMKKEILSVRPRKSLAPLTFTMPTEIALLGQSNAGDGGGGADATYTGAALLSGCSWVRNGTAVTSTYRTAGLPVGIVPYLHLNFPTSRVVQQAGDGENIIVQIETRLPALVANYTSLGASPGGLVYIQGEAETLNPAGSLAADYLSNLDKLARAIWGYYPNCPIYLIRLIMRTDNYTGAGNSVNRTVVMAAQDAVGQRYGNRLKVIDVNTPAQPAMADDVHAAPSAAGYGVVASRFKTAVGW